MVIHDAHQAISALKKVLPESFVFVLDTTDRSFIYRSVVSEELERSIIEFDRSHGIDVLSRKAQIYINKHGANTIGFKSIGTNTYLGFCSNENHPESYLSEAKRILESE